MEGRGRGEEEENGSAPVLKIQVKFSGRSIPVSLSIESTIKDLKYLLQPLTNVLPRGQKLIFKGKVLEDTMKLKSTDITNGSKLMLMASQGLHQGDGPITKHVVSSGSGLRKPSNGGGNAQRLMDSKVEVAIDKSRSKHWKITGVVALSGCQLKFIPEEVWGCGSSIRVLDISRNSIREVPAKIGSLSSIQKLLLNENSIWDECISWEGVVSLKSLTVLNLNHNGLTSLPSGLGALVSLMQLHVANNKLTSLPVEIGLLARLEILKVNNNRISSVQSRIGNCVSLVEVDLASNHLVDLPDTIGSLRNLKALHLSNNGLKSLPSTLFKLCTQLSTLDLHNTEITIDILRQFEGWEAFDERRRLKHQKQLDFRVGSSGAFDEGADKH
ncbi:LRR repeats and ubiquitin-like domain-containing protein At2g30105 [Papaver somniferum]|uniref:LRR repeats and ubiquitin-like domain-containing protein At2g30105 n=1 Tax=Papaver somniferum TaxID=3469 RepID=UPI000E6FD845|nr:LRR repeats and ubiquitin-like domain-containing protein At2g30105 [Papaver somniferum]XP_026454055.1 LRR repeats and ubiquitin-like domain-containing protein At2g30105 [Papaver somniferum]XP_026454056.1 LRR repeats and ubiquitin-like domain-containing protein At2g30105 [Papaver somniferum]